MLRLVLLLFGSFRAALHSRADLVIENLALRQQLAVLAHTGRRGRVTGAARLFWVTLRRLWARWSDVLVFVKPETALGRTVSQSAGSEACVANCSITPSSSTSVTFADRWESTVPTTIRTAGTTRLKRRLPAVVFPLPRGSRLCSRGSQAVGRSASPVPLGCVEEWADRFWRATTRHRAQR